VAAIEERAQTAANGVSTGVEGSQGEMRRAVGYALMAALLLGVSGCGLASGMFALFRRPAPSGSDGGPISPHPDGTPVKLVLYFGDAGAESLVAEERTVIQRGESREELAIWELIRGPADEGRFRTVPREAKLLSVQVVEGVAYVNFSREVQTRHPGGTTGERFTIQAIANTLATNNPAVQRVQFLVEGKTEEAIWGHATTSEPIPPLRAMIR
jgi:hypothetical protein